MIQRFDTAEEFLEEILEQSDKRRDYSDCFQYKYWDIETATSLLTGVGFKTFLNTEPSFREFQELICNADLKISALWKEFFKKKLFPQHSFFAPGYRLWEDKENTINKLDLSKEAKDLMHKTTLFAVFSSDKENINIPKKLETAWDFFNFIKIVYDAYLILCSRLEDTKCKILNWFSGNTNQNLLHKFEIITTAIKYKYKLPSNLLLYASESINHELQHINIYSNPKSDKNNLSLETQSNSSSSINEKEIISNHCKEIATNKKARQQPTDAQYKQILVNYLFKVKGYGWSKLKNTLTMNRDNYHEKKLQLNSEEHMLPYDELYLDGETICGYLTSYHHMHKQADDEFENAELNHTEICKINSLKSYFASAKNNPKNSNTTP